MKCIVVAIATIIIGFSNLFSLFLKMSHVDLYLYKLSSIYQIGQNFVIHEPIPFDLYPEVFSL